MTSITNGTSLFDGNLKTIDLNNPSAGSEFVFTVPDNKIWIPVGIEFSFAALGGGSARVPAVIYESATFRMAYSPIEGTIASGGGSDVRAIPNHGEQVSTPPPGILLITMPFPYPLHHPQQIKSETSNLGASDIFQNIVLTVIEFIRPNL